MSIGDFISKTASEALGRIIADAPGAFLSLFTSSAVCTIQISNLINIRLCQHLAKIGTPIWRPLSYIAAGGLDEKYLYEGEGACSVDVERDWQMFIVRHRPLVLKKIEPERGVIKYYVSYLRGFDIQGLIYEALNAQVFVKKSEKFRVILNAKDNAASMDYGTPFAVPPYWTSPALGAILSEIKTWRSSRTFCQSKGLPWRRGWLLYGTPGNGKTQSIKIAASIARVNLIPITLNCTDQQLRSIFDQARSHVPCIVLIEDIDDIIRGRQNVKDPEKGVSFSTLLNCIDGVDSTDGVIVAVTTNDLSAIDPALGRPRDESHWNQLSTRPGRLDRCIRFDNPDLEGRIAIGKLLLSEAEATALAHKHDDVSLVQFQALCREAAFANLQDLDAVVGAS